MRPDTFQTSAVTTSALVHRGPCAFGGALVGDKDGVNNMTITIYDGTVASTDYTEIVPTTIIDGTVNGIDGVSENHKIQCVNGIYVEVSGVGTTRVTVRYRPIG